ncbi:MAG: HEAT repeat domain-containing protein [Planctomycetota bacterium]|jgi:hypothetical protein
MNGKRNRRTGVGRLAGLAAAALALAGGSGCWCTGGLVYWASERTPRSRAIGVEVRGDGRERVVFEVRECPDRPDGRYELEIPMGWQDEEARASEYGSDVLEIEGPAARVRAAELVPGRPRLRSVRSLSFDAIVRGRRPLYGSGYGVAYVRRGERYVAEVFGYDTARRVWIRLGGVKIDAGRTKPGRGLVAAAMMPFAGMADFIGGVAVFSSFFSSTPIVPETPAYRSRLESLVRDLSSGNPSRRRAAVVELARHKARAKCAVPEIRRLLDDGDADVRLAACSTLRRLCPGSATECDPVVAGVLEEGSTVARRRAAGMLAACDGEAGTDALIRALDDADAKVRIAAVCSLGCRRPDSQDTDALIRALDDADAKVRVAAVESLSHRRADSQKVVPELERVAAGDRSWGVRRAAKKALKLSLSPKQRAACIAHMRKRQAALAGRGSR